MTVFIWDIKWTSAELKMKIQQFCHVCRQVLFSLRKPVVRLSCVRGNWFLNHNAAPASGKLLELSLRIETDPKKEMQFLHVNKSYLYTDNKSQGASLSTADFPSLFRLETSTFRLLLPEALIPRKTKTIHLLKLLQTCSHFLQPCSR